METMPPRVSIIVPCYNEQTTIRLLLDAIYRQSYPTGQMEVVVADGLSEDNTLGEIAAFKQNHPDLVVRVVKNEARTIPSGLNCAIRASRGETIVRMDAHSHPYPAYVERCLADLDAGVGDNVGGVWEIKPGGNSWIAVSIAVAAAHPLGVGNAGYRIGAQASAVDTVPFGAYRRTLLDEIGMFDETLLSNEDYEFNTRIRKAGGRVWLDPEIVTVYFARPTLRELARQYWRYGYWKLRMLRRYPDSLRWRQGLPPLFVLSLLVLLALAWWPVACWLLIGETSLYILVLFLAGLVAFARKRTFYLLVGLPLTILTMHVAWGGAFLWSLITTFMEKQKND